MAEIAKLIGTESPLEVGQKINEIIEKGAGGTGLQMFDTILKDHVLTYEESKGLALQGSYVYKEAVAGSRYGYPDFYTKCLEEYNETTATETVNGVNIQVHSNGHKFYDIANKTAIDEFFNTMGSAWFYGIDTDNECIFLPRNNYFEQSTGDVSEVGQNVEAGLPNITGTVNYLVSERVATEQSGSLTRTYSYNNNIKSSDSAKGVSSLSIDASLSNPIYGNSDTVQPNAVKKLLYICVGNTTSYAGVTEVVNQGMEILEQVNQGIETRVKLDGSNAEFVHIVETYQNGASWYRVYSDGWCEQGGHAIATSNSVAQQIALLKSYKDTNYSVVITRTVTNADNYLQVTITDQTTSSFTTGYSCNKYWQACGYIA